MSASGKLILLGAGHSHLQVVQILVKAGFGRNITLISDAPTIIYSGMFPGFLRGDYSLDEITIDVAAWCASLGVSFKLGSFCDFAPGIASDVEPRSVILKSGEQLRFDVFSLNIGSVIKTIPVDADSQVIPVKPFSEFVKHWPRSVIPRVIAVIGGGAAAIEVGAALKSLAEVHLYYAEKRLLATATPEISSQIENDLRAQKIHLHPNATVREVRSSRLVLSSVPESPPFDFIVSCAGSASSFLSTGMDRKLLSDDGYLKVDAQLRVPSLKNVFAAGDCIQFCSENLDKSGVQAVHQGKVLAANLIAALSDGGVRDVYSKRCREDLETYLPPKHSLYILGTAPKQARALWGAYSFSGRIPYFLKRWIDRNYVRQFLPR